MSTPAPTPPPSASAVMSVDARNIVRSINEGWFQRGLLFGMGFCLAPAILALIVFILLGVLTGGRG